MPKTSVVILNWNGLEHLRRFLPLLVERTPAEEAELVVADNGSTDGSMDYVARFPQVRSILFDQNYGFAEGYNRALAQVEADYFVLLNSDVEVTDGWLRPLTGFMDANPDVAACQPKIRAYRNRPCFEHAGAAGGMMDWWGYPYCRGRIMGYVEEDHGQYDSPVDCFWATGACLCIRAEAWKASGGLDGRFFAHMEEIDLCWRLGARGWRIACQPESTVFHWGGGSLSAENPRKTYLNFRNNLIMLYKNLPDARLRQVMLMRWLLDNVAACQMLLTGKQGDFKAVVKARRDFRKMKADYDEDRRKNLRLTTRPVPAGMTRRSIVWDYYIRRKRS